MQILKKKKIYSRINKLFSEEIMSSDQCLQLVRKQGLPHINKVKQYEIEWCSDDVLLWPNPEVWVALIPSTKILWDYWIGFWIIAENNLCDKHKFMILTRFVQQDNLHRWIQFLWFSKCEINR